MDKLNTAPKTNASLADFKQLGDKLRKELADSYKHTRALEDALGQPSRILPEGEPAHGATIVHDGALTGRRAARASTRPARTFDPPQPGTIMFSVYDYLKKHPDSIAPAIRKSLKMTTKEKSIQLSTALHTLKKRNLIEVKGRRNAYKYAIIKP